MRLRSLASLLICAAPALLMPGGNASGSAATVTGAPGAVAVGTGVAAGTVAAWAAAAPAAAPATAPAAAPAAAPTSAGEAPAAAAATASGSGVTAVASIMPMILAVNA